MNLQVNAIIEIIHQLLGNHVHTYNLEETYVDDTYHWMEILAAAAFVVKLMYHSTKDKRPGQMVLARYIILPINPLTYWINICQRKQAQLDKYIIRKNSIRINRYSRVFSSVKIQNPI